jgi:protein-histidine pros-kinase
VAVYGYSREEASGRVTHELFRTVFPESLQAVDDALAREGRWDGVLHHTCKDGRVLVISSRQALRRDADGKPDVIIELNSDITERAAGDQRLRDANVSLEAANRAKSRFLATMTHELRTPLNAILGFTGVMLMELPGPITDEQEAQLRTVQTSGRHLLSIINHLLDVAVIESGDLDVSIERIDGDELAQDVAAGLRTVADAKGIGLVVATTGPPPVYLYSDRRALRQILDNLVANAIAFTEHGEVRLETCRDGGSPATTFVRISDMGSGIKPEQQERLFDPFAHVSAAGRGAGEGAGLGLHKCSVLASALGATLSLDSVYGQGSTFTVAVPDPVS